MRHLLLPTVRCLPLREDVGQIWKCGELIRARISLRHLLASALCDTRAACSDGIPRDNDRDTA